MNLPLILAGFLAILGAAIHGVEARSWSEPAPRTSHIEVIQNGRAGRTTE